jgi:TolB-like protein/DNA-binding winged helix-turn-helix (wHTH) protein/Flp pilus assembly protein TadD
VLFSFADRTMDVDRRELRWGGEPVAVEPQVFDLLVYLIQNRDRVVSKDDLIASVWSGRIVSDSTLTSRITAARKAVGDSGDAQQLIRTIARKGIRFVGDVHEGAASPAGAEARALTPSPVAPSSEPAGVAAGSDGDTLVLSASRRASVAVMPFTDLDAAKAVPGGSADGLAHDVITRLAKLRSLFVIAQGTVFALRDRCVAPEEAGRMLSVDYVVGGSVRRRGNRLTVTVELAEARTARIVWAEVFDRELDDAFLVLDEIGDRIVASIDHEIEMIERNRAVLKPPNSLDAWEAYHRGLWHMYRFNKPDNDKARHFFETAARLDPTFSRAHAGLSFTHWQNAFQGWAEREGEIERAYAAAGQSLMADDRDPAAHWAMGRALWLSGRQDQSVAELEQAVDLSPNFALGHYTLAFVHSTSGDPSAAITASDRSRALSPFDPLLFGMLASRAMALVRLGRFEEAADWAVKAAARPNAHAHILAIAALCLALAGRPDEARVHLTAIRQAHPSYGFADFLAAFRHTPEGKTLFREGARRIGLE